jgi:hypothetical protein
VNGRKLVLHVGHDKTGSSMIQSVLALSADVMAKQGICYPEFATFDSARRGEISSGNLDSLQPDLKSNWKRAVADDPGATAVLFSNEGLFRRHARVAADIRDIQSRGVAVESIVVIRDPLDHAVSLFGQGLKRHGFTKALADALKNYAMPERVFDFITAFRADGIAVKVANYSRHTCSLVPTFAEMLGVDPVLLVWPSVKVVNRSLSGAEAYLMRRLNERFDVQVTMRIADALCNEMPDIPAGRPFLSPEEHAAFNARMAPMIEKVNAIIPEDAHYRLSSYADYAGNGMNAPGEPLSFTPEQIDLIVGLLPGGVRRGKSKSSAFKSALRRMFGR